MKELIMGKLEGMFFIEVRPDFLAQVFKVALFSIANIFKGMVVESDFRVKGAI
jgi:hypothetical protein